MTGFIPRLTVMRWVIFLLAALLMGSASGAQATPSQLHVAVLLVNFQDDQSHPVTTAQVTGNWLTNQRSVAAWLNETSYGQSQIANVDVRGWFTIPYSVSGPCDFNTNWETAARAQAGDLSAYDHLAFVFSNFSACPAVAFGAGTITSGKVWGGPNLGFDIGIAAHEFAHSIGLSQHAGTTACVTCTLNEGGDPWTVWAGAAYDLHGSERTYLGWLTPRSVSASGTYSLAPLSAQDALRIPRPDGTFLDVDYRKPFGLFDTNLDPNGITVRLVLANARSYLIGNSLQPGYSVYDSQNRIAVTEVSAGASGAQVQVGFNVDPPPPPPPPPPPVAQCADGIDNDGDGKIDYPADKQCTSTQDDDEKRR